MLQACTAIAATQLAAALALLVSRRCGLQFLTALLLAIATPCCAAELPHTGCRDKDGQPVDWWVALKFPGGGTYAFIDAQSQVSNGSYAWQVAYHLDDVVGSALAATLQQLYPRSDDAGYVMWNDEFPSGHAWFTGGHAKGVLGFGDEQGFWLLHSVPKFPAAPCPSCPDGGAGYTGIAPAQLVYGQSFLCVTAPAAQLDLMARATGASGVFVYDAHFPVPLLGRLPAAEALALAAPYGRPALVPGAPPAVAAQLVASAEGATFAVFAKAPSLLWPVPLHEQLVGAFFKSGMVWETWQHGEDLPQVCGGRGMAIDAFSSFTIASVEVPLGASWTVNQDHAKWGVTAPGPPECCGLPGSGSPLGAAVCFADLNRQPHQALRGGGAICVLGNDALWRAFNSIITGLQPCEGSTAVAAVTAAAAAVA